MNDELYIAEYMYSSYEKTKRGRRDMQTEAKTKQSMFEETKEACRRELEMFDKGTVAKPSAALQTNVGHIFHWE